jgi:Leucine-rich repeat (LRR) protein
VTINLKNLTTLDVSYNGLEALDGVEAMSRLKRLLSKNNQIQELEPLYALQSLVEIDLENNPVDNYVKLLDMLKNKSDILVVNLKLSPVFLTVQSYE